MKSTDKPGRPKVAEKTRTIQALVPEQQYEYLLQLSFTKLGEENISQVLRLVIAEHLAFTEGE